MDKEEKEKLAVSEAEYDALNGIRGLAQDAHFMVMTASRVEGGGWTLEGTSEAFGQLTRDLADEIEFRLSPKTQLKRIEKLYCRLTPDCGDF